jgi:hypothetical protein
MSYSFVFKVVQDNILANKLLVDNMLNLYMCFFPEGSIHNSWRLHQLMMQTIVKFHKHIFYRIAAFHFPMGCGITHPKESRSIF